MARQVTERLRASNITKRFGRTLALDRAELSVAAGEVHAVIGENGAGKSTLIKILAGAMRADEGALALDGARYAPDGPLDARRMGIAVVYQEPLLCPDLTVSENVLLGTEPTRHGIVDRRAGRVRVDQALAQLGVTAGSSELSADTKVSQLSLGTRQLVAIARALAQFECRVLVLDEPTSSLTATDVERLFAVVRELRSRGLSIIYISHFLEEVARIADTFTVLRDGRSVGSGRLSAVTTEDLVTLMAGRSVERLLARLPHTAGDVILQASELAGSERPLRASFELRRGEVLGIAGLVGSGRTELLRAIFGLDRVRRGQIRVAAFVGPASPARRLAQGVGFLSEDRQGEGLAEGLSVSENLTLSKLASLGPFGLVLPARRAAAAQGFIDRLGIKTSGPDQLTRDLSGGNQQKVALARLLYHDVDVLLLDEPTRGIDVRSRTEIYRLIAELAAAGKAVLVVSSYFPELLGIADRISIMRRGVLEPARPASDLDERGLIKGAAGA